MPWIDRRMMRSLLETMEEILVVAKGIRHMQTMPGPIKVIFTGETFEGEGKMLKQLSTFDLEIEALPEKNDVVSRDLKLYQEGALIDERTVSPTELLVKDFKAVQHKACRVELRDLDDAGLWSLTKIHDFEVQDVTAPAMPGAITVHITGEVFEEEPEPIEDVPVEEQPAPEEPPTEEPTPVEEPTGEVPAEETPVEEPPAEGEEPTV